MPGALELLALAVESRKSLATRKLCQDVYDTILAGYHPVAGPKLIGATDAELASFFKKSSQAAIRWARWGLCVRGYVKPLGVRRSLGAGTRRSMVWVINKDFNSGVELFVPRKTAAQTLDQISAILDKDYINLFDQVSDIREVVSKYKGSRWHFQT